VEVPFLIQINRFFIVDIKKKKKLMFSKIQQNQNVNNEIYTL